MAERDNDHIYDKGMWLDTSSLSTFFSFKYLGISHPCATSDQSVCSNNFGLACGFFSLNFLKPSSKLGTDFLS